MRIVVTGSRDYVSTVNDVATDLLKTLTHHVERVGGHLPAGKDVTIIHGGAAGLDTIAGQAAVLFDWDVEVHPADWDAHGKAAGPIRNQEMLDSGCDFVVAFPIHPRGTGSPGTWGCVGEAEKRELPVYIVTP